DAARGGAELAVRTAERHVGRHVADVAEALQLPQRLDLPVRRVGLEVRVFRIAGRRRDRLGGDLGEAVLQEVERLRVEEEALVPDLVAEDLPRRLEDVDVAVALAVAPRLAPHEQALWVELAPRPV